MKNDKTITAYHFGQHYDLLQKEWRLPKIEIGWLIKVKITDPLWKHPFINTIMLILLSQNEQGISALDLYKHIFPSGSSPMKNTFPWMQRHYVSYYKGEQLAWSKPTWNSLNTPAYEHNAWSQIGRFRKVSWHIYYRFPVTSSNKFLIKELSLLTIYGSWCTRKYIVFFFIFDTKHIFPNASKT